MALRNNSSIAKQLASLPLEQRQAVLASLSITQKAALSRYWPFLARPNQLAPDGDWNVWLALAGRGFGKQVCNSTKVLRRDGWTTVGECSVGDTIFDENGSPCKILAIHAPTPTRCYRLTFDDGEVVDACEDHQWVTWTHADRKAYGRSPYESQSEYPADWVNWKLKRLVGHQIDRDVVEKVLKLHKEGMSARGIADVVGINRGSLARHIKAGCYVEREAKVYPDSPGPKVRTTQEIVDTFRHGERGDLNHSIPLCRPLEFPAAKLPADPWSLGYWLGNGSVGSVCGNLNDLEDFKEQWKPRYKRIREEPAHTRFTAYSSDFDMSETSRTKYVPKEYLLASIDQRRSLLAGLLDSDGHCVPANSQVEFCSMSRQLTDDVMFLVRSLGDKPRLFTGRATLNGKDCGEKYRVCWRPSFNPFRFRRKRAAYKPPDKQALRTRQRMIVDYEEIPSKPMRCFTVDSPNSMFLVGEGLIPTHNTRLGAEWVIKYAEEHPGCRIALIGPTAADVRDTMIEGESGIISCAQGHFDVEYRPSKRRIECSNGTWITGFSAEEPERLRGPQHHAFWGDELCLSGESLIQTADGERPINSVSVGDKVWTRQGLRKVLEAGLTGYSKDFVVLTFGANSLRCTPNHPILTSRGFIPAKEVVVGDTICRWLSGEEKSGGSGPITTRIVRGSYFTERSIRRPMDLWRPIFKSIMWMGTKPITSLITWLQSRLQSIIRCMSLEAFVQQALKSAAQWSEKGGNASNLRQKRAGYAEENSRVQDNVPRSVEQNVSGSTSTPITETVTVSTVEFVTNSVAEPVYNLHVSGEEEYFAQGILTHNCSWKYDIETWDMLMFGLRLGRHPRGVVTTTPKPKKLIRDLAKALTTHVTKGSTYDNLDNLAPIFRQQVLSKYEGTRLGRQEIEAEILDDVPGALWSKALIEPYRVEAYPENLVTVVGVDPAISANKDSDRTGIIVSGIDPESLHMYVLADLTARYKPAEWAKIVVQAFHEYRCVSIVAEVNQGGDLVEEVIQQEWGDEEEAPYVGVRATMSKRARAEPIVMLYEQGKVHHVGSDLEHLEDEQCAWDPLETPKSPDRVDALVWGLTELYKRVNLYSNLTLDTSIGRRARPWQIDTKW